MCCIEISGPEADIQSGFSHLTNPATGQWNIHLLLIGLLEPAVFAAELSTLVFSLWAQG